MKDKMPKHTIRKYTGKKKWMGRMAARVVAAAMLLMLIPSGAMAADAEELASQDVAEELVELSDSSTNDAPDVAFETMLPALAAESEQEDVEAFAESTDWVLKGCSLDKNKALLGEGGFVGDPHLLPLYVYDNRAFFNSLKAVSLDLAGYWMVMLPLYLPTTQEDLENPTIASEVMSNGRAANPNILNILTYMTNIEHGGINPRGSSCSTPYILLNQIPSSLMLGQYYCILANEGDLTAATPKDNGQTYYQAKVAGSPDIREAFAHAGYLNIAADENKTTYHQELISLTDGTKVGNGVMTFISLAKLEAYYTIDIAPVTVGYKGEFSLNGFNTNSSDLYDNFGANGYTIPGGQTIKSDVKEAISFYQGSYVDDTNTYESGAGFYGDVIDDFSYTLGSNLGGGVFTRGTNALDANIVGDVGARGYGQHGDTIPASFGVDATNPFNADTEHGYMVDYVDITVYDPATGAVLDHKALSESNAVEWLAANPTLQGRTEIRVAYTTIPQISKTSVEGLVQKGDKIAYTLTLTDEDLVSGKEVTVSDPLPAQVKGLTYTLKENGTEGSAQAWPADNSISVHIPKASAAGVPSVVEIQIEAEVIADWSSEHGGNNLDNVVTNQASMTYKDTTSYTEIVTHQLAPTPSYTMTKERMSEASLNSSGKYGFESGDEVEYRVSIKNTGDIAIEVDVADAFANPEYFTVPMAASVEGAGITCTTTLPSESAHVKIPEGSTAEVIFKATVKEDVPENLAPTAADDKNNATDGYANTATVSNVVTDDYEVIETVTYTKDADGKLDTTTVDVTHTEAGVALEDASDTANTPVKIPTPEDPTNPEDPVNPGNPGNPEDPMNPDGPATGNPGAVKTLPGGSQSVATGDGSVLPVVLLTLVALSAALMIIYSARHMACESRPKHKQVHRRIR